MKIKYYGTCAAEGFPGMFCSCPTCERARELKGRNIRTRSQAAIDDTLLIDFPADTYMHVINYGLDLRHFKSCLITHAHDDHLYDDDLQYRVDGFAYYPDFNRDKGSLTVYTSRRSGKQVRARIAENNMRDKDTVKWVQVDPFKTYNVEGYEVTPLKADHDISLDPLIYIIKKSGKTVLYAHDTGYFPDDDWEYLVKEKPFFNFVSLDCTCITEDDAYRNHMGLKACANVKNRLIKEGFADENTVFVLNHFSHNGELCYTDLVPIAKKLGFEVSYDTAEYEF